MIAYRKPDVQTCFGKKFSQKYLNVKKVDKKRESFSYALQINSNLLKFANLIFSHHFALYFLA